MQKSLDQLCVTTLRMLAADAVEQANSGHPGLPLGAAPMAYVLWHRMMRHNPTNPFWPDRDRFILSAGHGSALLYGLLHLSGYDLTLADLKQFRQWESRTPGHPEYGLTPGVEATTGPLGQGFAMGVGMALAERHMAQRFNKNPSFPLVNHHIYALVSDGDLMEGITAEAASLAGHLRLGKLIYLYDDNRITIEGSTDLTFSENVAARFESYQWQVLEVEDGEDLDSIEGVLRQAQAEAQRPTLIRVRTQIGFGSPKAGSSAVHGAPLGNGMAATRHFFQWPDTRFHIPPEALNHFRSTLVRGQKQEAEWSALLEEMRIHFPEEVNGFVNQTEGILPEGWDRDLATLNFEGKAHATRVASGMALNALSRHLPSLIGGSADLAPSNNTWMKETTERNIHFGVREHAMAAISNGIALHKGLIPFCATFLVFSDYMRGAIRLSALMELPILYILTHDSIAVGEDGPTHQPIEHIASLRIIPHLVVLRPADAFETVAAWKLAITLKRPAALILSRQNLPLLSAETATMGVARGAYVVADCVGEPQLTLLATGSEVHLVMESRIALLQRGISRVRVVSMPSLELFEEQPKAYQEQILSPHAGVRLAVEAGSSMGWHRWVGENGAVLALDRFGASAPGNQVLHAFGFSVENVVAMALSLLAGAP